MAKMRVYELANSLGLEIETALRLLREVGASPRNHMSVVDRVPARRVRQLLKQNPNAALPSSQLQQPAATAAPQPAPAAAKAEAGKEAAAATQTAPSSPSAPPSVQEVAAPSAPAAEAPAPPAAKAVEAPPEEAKETKAAPTKQAKEAKAAPAKEAKGAPPAASRTADGAAPAGQAPAPPTAAPAAEKERPAAAAPRTAEKPAESPKERQREAAPDGASQQAKQRPKADRPAAQQETKAARAAQAEAAKPKERPERADAQRPARAKPGPAPVPEVRPAGRLRPESEPEAGKRSGRARHDVRDELDDDLDERPSGRRGQGKKSAHDLDLLDRPVAGGGRKKKAKAQRAAERTPAAPQQPTGPVTIPDTLTVSELAETLGIPATSIILKLMEAGVMASINQSIDFEVAASVAEKLGFEVKRPEKQAVTRGTVEEPEENLQPRPPVVTIMGHVDHGKTTLLDVIRKTKVAQTEAGGITQHIGAYQVEVNGQRITFLDTPGHEAFTAMRSRGAQVTDIAVLVVAADDGVMPQTVEAINHVKAANVPIIVAINKIDRPGANPDRVKQQLVEYGLVPEEWGGDTICVPVSALKRQGIDELLEMILLVAELRELKANPDRPAVGVVIEAKLDKTRGPVATVLVQSGTLRVGDSIVVGSVYGRVRAMYDEWGAAVEEAGPSRPVEVLGLSDVPRAGDKVEAVEDDRLAREIALERAEKERATEVQRSAGRIRLSEIYAKTQSGDVKDLNLVIKADVQGSVEALRQAVEKIHSDHVRINVIHAAVGGINESDVGLAATSDAVIIGFNVRPESAARRAAEREGVEIRLYRVIYEIIEDLEKAIEGMLEPTYEEVVLGRAEVRALFRVPNVGTVAGCYVTEGVITRQADVRLLRNHVVVYEGKIASLKRFKDDVREVNAGFECGIALERFNDIKEGDIIEAYRMEEVKRGS